jgi:hypothetical protein
MPIDDYEDFTFRCIPALIEEAENGDTNAALTLFGKLLEAARGNPDAPRELIDYFDKRYDALCEAGKSTEIAKALNLTKPKHRPRRPDQWLIDGVLAMRVQEWRDRGSTFEEAIAKTAGQTGRSESKVKQAYLATKKSRLL